MQFSNAWFFDEKNGGEPKNLRTDSVQVEIELKTQFQFPTYFVHCKIILDDLEFAKPSLIYFSDLSDSEKPFDHT